MQSAPASPHLVAVPDPQPALAAVPAASPAAHRWAMLSRLLVASDLAAGTVAGLLTAASLALPAGRALLFAACAALSWAALSFACGASARKELRTWASGIPDARRLVTAALLMSWGLVGLAAAFGGAPVLLAAAGGVTVLAVSAVLRALARAFVHRLAPLRQRTLVVGSGQVASQVVVALQRHRETGLDAVGMVDDDVHDVGGPRLPVLGAIADLPEVLREHRIDRVVVAFSRASHDELHRCIRTCRDAGVTVDIVPRLFEFLDGAQSVDQLGGLPLLSIGVPQFGRTAAAAKRALDVAGAAAGLLALAPVLAVAAVAIKLTSPGPVLFRQPRTGRDGELFDVLKFRSMYVDAEERKAELVAANAHADGRMFKVARDPRVTPAGRVLRSTSLDELPQLLNVLLGQMSLVGPRPLIPQESAHLDADWHLRRLHLRPGMTGLWQVSGRSDLSFADMVRLDYQYVAGWSLARDVEILLATVPAVLASRGAY